VIYETLFQDGKLRPEWIVSEQSSVSSETYISEEEIIQSRPLFFYQSWHQRMKFLCQIDDQNDDPQGLLRASFCEYEQDSERGVFWVKYQRIDLSSSPALKDYSYNKIAPSDLESLFVSTLPSVRATQTLLRKQNNPPGFFNYQIAKGALIKLINERELASILREKGIDSKVSFLPESRVVLSHGDALLKNIVNTPSGFRLIDWEVLGLFPIHSDYMHALVWILLRMPAEDWRASLDRLLPLILEDIEMDQEQARIAAYWQVIREALFWRSPDQLFSYVDQAETLL
jgi:hypothetical protein